VSPLEPEHGAQQPFLVRIAGDPRPATDLRGVRDGAICYLPNAALTDVQLLDKGEIAFSDVGSPAGDDPDPF
jgi:hypothetical protein